MWRDINYDMDAEVEGLVGLLNKRGYVTAGYCAGHSVHEVSHGYVSFRNPNLTEEERSDIEAILRGCGLEPFKFVSRGSCLLVLFRV